MFIGRESQLVKKHLPSWKKVWRTLLCWHIMILINQWVWLLMHRLLVWAPLSHVPADGGERPIAYASRSRSAGERNYSEMEKEALAIIFGIEKFHQYTCMVEVSTYWLITDHLPFCLVQNVVYLCLQLYFYDDGQSICQPKNTTLSEEHRSIMPMPIPCLVCRKKG